jgi:hypothetical protein
MFTCSDCIPDGGKIQRVRMRKKCNKNTTVRERENAERVVK